MATTACGRVTSGSVQARRAQLAPGILVSNYLLTNNDIRGSRAAPRVHGMERESLVKLHSDQQWVNYDNSSTINDLMRVRDGSGEKVEG